MEAIERINSLVDTLRQESTVDITKRTIDNVIDTVVNQKLTMYETEFKEIDRLIGVAPNEILLIGGPAGAGKTRLLIAMMYRILERYKNVSVQWFNFEDPADKIIRCFAGSHMLMKEELIRGKRKKMTTDQTTEFTNYVNNHFRKYDIMFVEEQKYIKDVHNMFVRFCKAREGRMNICIIDNLLLLEDKTNDRDDIIAAELVKIRKHTNGLIIPVHHFNDEQQAKDMLKSAYRPRLIHLKGRESYRRACTQILLINKPGNYPDLVMEYKGWEEIMKRLYIIEVAKNRDNTANDDSETLIRMWCNLDFIQFQDIE
jgi:replicative DNA helicase